MLRWIQQPLEAAGHDFAANLRHAALDVGKIPGGNHAHGGKHVRVRERTLDIEQGQALIEVDRGGITFDDLGHGLRKTRRPGLSLVVELVLGGGGSIFHG